MDWKQSCRERLSELLDEHGDLTPPWEKFPTYERMTIGWRMGTGEDWAMLFWTFLEELDTDYDIRLAYLNRHAPAPCSWSDSVWNILYPNREKLSEPEDGFDDDDDPDELLALGLIASDIAYPTWLAQQDEITWPWKVAKTPSDAARYWTREFWFWSRQVQSLRDKGDLDVPRIPLRWRSCASAVKTGQLPELNPAKGLLTLAQMLCAGQVLPPWQLGMTPDAFADTFESDMGYVDAFRLWHMSAFDDDEHVRRYLADFDRPDEWEPWLDKQFHLLP